MHFLLLLGVLLCLPCYLLVRQYIDPFQIGFQHQASAGWQAGRQGWVKVYIVQHRTLLLKKTKPTARLSWYLVTTTSTRRRRNILMASLLLPWLRIMCWARIVVYYTYRGGNRVPSSNKQCEQRCSARRAKKAYHNTYLNCYFYEAEKAHKYVRPNFFFLVALTRARSNLAKSKVLSFRSHFLLVAVGFISRWRFFLALVYFIIQNQGCINETPCNHELTSVLYDCHQLRWGRAR